MNLKQKKVRFLKIDGSGVSAMWINQKELLLSSLRGQVSGDKQSSAMSGCLLSP